MKVVLAIGKKLTVVTGLLLSLVLVSAVPVSAVSNSLGVRPRVDHVIKPGEKVTGTLQVVNLSKTDELRIDISVIDFGARNETGAPSLLLDQTEPTRWSLKPYLTIAKSATIQAGKASDIPYTIAIPADLGAGSYYGAIKYSVAGVPGTDNVTIASSTATLLFVRVPGEADESLVLKDFGAFTPDKSGESGSFDRMYTGTPPKYLAYRLQNKGNIASRPTGSIQLTGLFGKKVKTIENINPNDSLILIEQTRRFDVCLNEKKISRTDRETGRNVVEKSCNDPGLSPGRYTAHLAMVYGENGSASHELIKAASFWYVPMWFVIAVLAGIALLITGTIVLIRVFRHRSKKHKKR